MAIAQYRGINYPLKRNGKEFPAKAVDKDLIKQSLVQIVLTPKGSRLCRPEFGSNVLNQIFENNDDLHGELFKSDLIRCIIDQESRIVLKDIVLAKEDTTLYVNIIYMNIFTQQIDQVTIGLPIAQG